VAHHGPHGAYTPIASEAAQEGSASPSALKTQCEEWIGDLSDGGYRYAVIGPDQRTQSRPPVEAFWTQAAGGSKIEQSDLVSVFRVGQLNASACGSLQAKQPRVVIGTINPSYVPLNK